MLSGKSHIHGKKLYLTVNTLLKEDELSKALENYLVPLYEAGLDAVIVQDFGVLSWISKNLRDMGYSCKYTDECNGACVCGMARSVRCDADSSRKRIIY